MGIWMIFGSLWMIIFWGGIIALIVWGVKKATSRQGSYSGSDQSNLNAIEIARQRYAKGEITREEFE